MFIGAQARARSTVMERAKRRMLKRCSQKMTRFLVDKCTSLSILFASEICSEFCYYFSSGSMVDYTIINKMGRVLSDSSSSRFIAHIV